MEVLKIYLIFKTSIIPNSNMSNTCKPSNLSFIQRIQLNDGVALKKIFPEKILMRVTYVSVKTLFNLQVGKYFNVYYLFKLQR